MNIVAFNGSPRKHGNTESLMREALRGTGLAESALTFDLNTMDIRPCQNCGGCDKTGTCILEDEMDVIYDALRRADRIILASPIFFFALSAQTKIMVDRCQALWCEKYLLKRAIETALPRKGLVLLVGGMKKDKGMECASASATAWLRTLSVPVHETLSYLGVDAKGDILKHPTAMKDAYEAGQRLVG